MSDIPTYFEPMSDESTRNTATTRVPLPASPGAANTASSLHQISQLYPWLKPDVALAIAQSGVDPHDQRVAALAHASAQSKVKHGFNWLSPGDWVDKGAAIAHAQISDTLGAAKAAVRDVGVGLEAGGQVLSSLVKERARSEAQMRAQGLAEGQGGLPKGLRQQDQAAAQASLTDPNNPGARFSPNINPLTSNSLAVIAGDVVHGKKVDLGTGFFPGGGVETDVKKRAVAEASVPGVGGTRQGYTMGRGLATSVFEPGSNEYKLMSGLVDAGVSWELDPTALAMGKLGEIREANKTFGAAGLVDGAARKTVVADKVSEWLDGSTGRKVLENVAGESNARYLWEKLQGLTPAQAVELSKTTTPEEARGVLEPLLGVSIRTKPTDGFVGALPSLMNRAADHVRILGQMPGGQLDLNDANAVGRQIVNLMRNAKVDPKLIDQRFAQAGAATSNIGRGEAVKAAYGDVNRALLGRGVQESVANRASQLFDEARVGAAKFNVDAIGQNVGSLGATINGDGLATAHPQLIQEYLDHAMPQADARTIRRLASPLRPLLAKSDELTGETLPRLPVSVMDFAMNKVWRPLTIARPATALRIIAETQARMGAVGMDSLMSHPIEAISWIVGRKGDALGAEFNAAEDFSTFKKFMSTRRINVSDGAKARLWDTVRRDQPDYLEGVAGEIAQLHSDPIARRLAGGWENGSPKAVNGVFDKVDRVPGGLTGNDIEDAKNWFWNGEPGKTLRLQLAEDASKTELKTSRVAADRYIDEVAQRIQTKTGGNHDLLNAIATGQHAGEHIMGEGATTASGWNRRFLDLVQQASADGFTPPVIKTARYVRNSRNAQLLDTIDSATSTIMHTLVGAPLSTVSASPAFRQLYWQRMAELGQHLTPEAKTTVLENAERFGIPEAIKGAIRDAPVGGAYSAEHAHILATGYAADQMPKLMHTLVNKSQFADVARNFFPFAEVWKNSLKAWASIGTKEPQVFRRFQQTINGARESGFFAPDPQTGEETYTFPLSGVVTRHILGVSVPLTGNVAGLNMFSASPLLPGFGPVVQIPVAKLLPDKPQFDELRKMIAPYGTEELGASFVPGWVSKLNSAAKASDSDRVFANTVSDMAASLYSTGKYDTSSQDGVDHLLADARTKARRLYLIRTLAQFAGPTPLSPKFTAVDKHGDTQLALTMANELQRLTAEDKTATAAGKPLPYNADERFLQEFGTNALLFLQSKTQRTGTGPLSKVGLDWVRTNTGVVKKYPDVYGFFAPQGADFNYDAYMRLIKDGELKTLTPKQFVEAANTRAARMIYANVRDQMGVRAAATTQGRVTLSNLRDQLVKHFPGYEPGIVDTGKRDMQIRQLRTAVADPRLEGNDVAQATQVYLEARDAALATLKAHGLLSLTSKQAAPYAAHLKDAAQELSTRVPGFADVFDYVFSGELG